MQVFYANCKHASKFACRYTFQMQTLPLSHLSVARKKWKTKKTMTREHASEHQKVLRTTSLSSSTSSGSLAALSCNSTKCYLFHHQKDTWFQNLLHFQIIADLQVLPHHASRILKSFHHRTRSCKNTSWGLRNWLPAQDKHSGDACLKKSSLQESFHSKSLASHIT